MADNWLLMHSGQQDWACMEDEHVPLPRQSDVGAYQEPGNPLPLTLEGLETLEGQQQQWSSITHVMPPPIVYGGHQAMEVRCARSYPIAVRQYIHQMVPMLDVMAFE